MANSVYQINKGINQSIEFKGLKAQYIWYLGGGIVILMVMFAILYFIALPSYLCMVTIAAIGTLMVIKIYKMSHKYGEHGLMKALAKKRLPKAIRSRARNLFIKL
jgi:hypothetical protein